MLWPSTPSGTRGTASPAGWRGTSRRMLSVKPCSDHTGWSSSEHTLTLHLTFDRPRDGGTKFVISSPLTLSEFENEVVGPNVFRNTRQPANYQVMRMMTGWLAHTGLITDHCSLVWAGPSTWPLTGPRCTRWREGILSATAGGRERRGSPRCWAEPRDSGRYWTPALVVSSRLVRILLSLSSSQSSGRTRDIRNSRTRISSSRVSSHFPAKWGRRGRLTPTSRTAGSFATSSDTAIPTMAGGGDRLAELSRFWAKFRGTSRN